LEVEVLSNSLPLVAVVFGWPAVIASITLASVGVSLGSWRVALAGALLGSPFLFYLFATPRFRWVALVVALLYLGSARAVAGLNRALALAMAAPFVILAVFVAWTVLNQ
jgi:hypothetical protein